MPPVGVVVVVVSAEGFLDMVEGEAEEAPGSGNQRRALVLRHCKDVREIQLREIDELRLDSDC